ncbi:MAG: class I SAM-dependent methyltransferase, partial [Candidatus Binatia bacterium]
MTEPAQAQRSEDLRHVISKEGKRSPRVVWVEGQVRRRYAKARLLDVGCIRNGEDPVLHLALRGKNFNAQVIGVDISVEGLLKWHLPNTLAADGQRLPFKDASFDV